MLSKRLNIRHNDVLYNQEKRRLTEFLQSEEWSCCFSQIVCTKDRIKGQRNNKAKIILE